MDELNESNFINDKNEYEVNVDSVYLSTATIYRKGNNKKEFWHYTSLNSIISIFNSYINRDKRNDKSVDNHVKECSIWASNVRYMNDPEEYCAGERKLIEYVNKDRRIKTKDKDAIINASNDRYNLISFSYTGDSLDQWKWYGKETGVSICFNMNKIETCVYKTEKDNDKTLYLYDYNNKPLGVCYKEKDIKNYYMTLMKLYKQNKISCGNIAPLFVPFCKDINYEREMEARMVFYTPPNSDKGIYDYKYNTSDSKYTKPAVCVKLRLREANNTDTTLLTDHVDSYPNEDDNIITKVIVGPGNTQELIFNSLIHIFDNDYYRFVKSTERPSGNVIMNLNNLDKGQSDWVIDTDKRIRFAYKCHNGLYILKSNVLFRK